MGVDSFDPHRTRSDDARALLRSVYEPLLRRDHSSLRPSPGLATEVTRTGRTSWLVRLRSGVLFSDGTAFDAAAVRSNIERAIDPSSKSRHHEAFGSLIADLDVPDGLTLRIETRSPYAPLPERFAAFSMVAPHASVGTGPYLLGSSADVATVVLERNERHWGRSAAYARVTYRHIADGEASLRALNAGDVDVAIGLPLDSAARLEAGLRVTPRPAPNVLELRMDARGRGGPTPFTDVRVRRAVAHAVDAGRISREILHGYASPVATSVIPSMFGHDPAVRPYIYDPDRSRFLLAEAGYPSGFETPFRWLPASVWPRTADIVDAIAGDLGAVGIVARTKSVTAKEMSGLTRTGGAGPLFIRNDPMGGSYDGSFAFFYLRQRYPYAYYWSDELEALIVEAEEATRAPIREAALSRAQQLLHDEAPYVWLFSGFVLVGSREHVGLDRAFVGPELRPERAL